MPILPRSVAVLALLFVSASVACAEAPSAELWSLYLREHSAAICGRALTEQEETELDESQQEARKRLGLSVQQAASLYRQARAVTLSSRSSLCNSDGSAELDVRAEWSSGR